MSGKPKSQKRSRSRLGKAKAKVGDLADQVKKLLGKYPATAGLAATGVLLGLYLGKDDIRKFVENVTHRMGGGKKQAFEMLRALNAALVVLIERSAEYVEGAIPLAGPLLRKLANSLKFNVPPEPAPALPAPPGAATALKDSEKAMAAAWANRGREKVAAKEAAANNTATALRDPEKAMAAAWANRGREKAAAKAAAPNPTAQRLRRTSRSRKGSRRTRSRRGR